MWLKPSLLWLGLALGMGGVLWSDLDVVLVHSPIEAYPNPNPYPYPYLYAYPHPYPYPYPDP